MSGARQPRLAATETPVVASALVQGNAKSLSPRLAPTQAHAEPLSPEAFGDRFAAGSWASGHLSKRLLARPAASDPHGSFQPRPAVVADHRSFEPLAPVQVAALPTADHLPEEAGEVTVAVEVMEPIALAALPREVLAPAFRPKAEAPETRRTRAVVEEPERPAPILAFARPDDPIADRKAPSKSGLIPWPGLGSKKRTAIYDISAGVVHMPNGEKLEAHSGRGSMRDNPKYAHVKMRGPTPPSTYKLTMREARFHGVEAIRLTPVDGVAPLGRVGLLAHTYLLRVPGDSSGCIVFKNYDRFLAAFKRGAVDRIVVVPRLKDAPNAPSAPQPELVALSRSR